MEQKKSKFEIITKDAVDTTIIMNGQDITENALSVTFKHAAGEVPTVTIEYLADECIIRTLGDLIVKKRKPGCYGNRSRHRKETINAETV